MKLRSIAIAGALAITGVVAGTAAPAGAADTTVGNCVTVIDQPDMGEKFCYYTKGPCLVTETRTTFIGTETYCTVRNPLG
jgi:uncharacterized membrane protein